MIENQCGHGQYFSAISSARRVIAGGPLYGTFFRFILIMAST